MQREIYSKIYSKSKNYGRVFTYFKETDVFITFSYMSIVLTILNYVGLFNLKAIIVVTIPAVIYVLISTFKSSSKQETYIIDMIFYYLSGRIMIIPDNLEECEVIKSTIPFIKEEFKKTIHHSLSKKIKRDINIGVL